MKNNNVSFRAEIIEKGNTDFIFLYRRASGVTEFIHSQPMPECYGELDDRGMSDTTTGRTGAGLSIVRCISSGKRWL